MSIHHALTSSAVWLVCTTSLLASVQDQAGGTESYVDRVKREGAYLELSLKDAIRLALLNNLEIQIENYNEELNRELILGTKGFYDPLLILEVGWDSRRNPTSSILDAGRGVSINTFQSVGFSSILQQNVQSGGQFRLSFDNNRSTTNSLFRFMNPSFGSNFDLSFTQPLWRGFLKTQTERQLKLHNLDHRISDSQFKQKVSEIIQQVENQFWELVFAVENHETRRQSMELAALQCRNNERRVQVGVLAPIEITSSQAEVATREQEMIQGEVQIINAQNGLKRLLAADNQSSLWNLTLLPTDRPQMQPIGITLPDAISMALERRPELEQIQLELEKVGVDRDYYRKETKPQVNLVANLASTGRAGQIFQDILADTDGDGVPDTRVGRSSDLSNPFFGGLGSAWSQVFGYDYINYGVALNLQVPLRNRTDEAQLAQVGINERRYFSRLKNQQQLILVEVRNSFEEIAIQGKRLDAARVARRLSEEQLQGENKRFEAGLSTNFELLRYQRDLAQAQVQELRALVDYQLAVTALQKAMYTIVDERDLVVARRNGEAP